jgi:hypothetical protein
MLQVLWVTRDLVLAQKFLSTGRRPVKGVEFPVTFPSIGWAALFAAQRNDIRRSFLRTLLALAWVIRLVLVKTEVPSIHRELILGSTLELERLVQPGGSIRLRVLQLIGVRDVLHSVVLDHGLVALFGS